MQYALVADLPPAPVRRRATGNDDPESFRAAGHRLAAVFISAIEEHAGASPGPVLDWGCGPGRVAMHVVRQRPAWDLSGCDVDAEAVAWCNQNIEQDAYAVTGILPPLPCPDERFGAIIACSVFTHMGRAVQEAWLPEIRRILRPGGVLIASVHGEPAARKFMPALPTILADNGIFDELLALEFGDMLPPGYYRTVFQSEAWTRENWGKHLDVVSYAEAGLTDVHDLVVCK